MRGEEKWLEGRKDILPDKEVQQRKGKEALCKMDEGALTEV